MSKNVKKTIKNLCENEDEHDEYVSALSNAVACHKKKYGYFVWGVNNDTHEMKVL